MSTLNERGHEVPDPNPLTLPVGFKRPESLVDQIKRFVRRELSEVADAQNHETFDEADDFLIEDDDYDPSSPWELNFDQESEERPSAKRKRESAAAAESGTPGGTDSHDRNENRTSTDSREHTAATSASNGKSGTNRKGNSKAQERSATADDSRRAEQYAQFVEFQKWLKLQEPE